MITIPKIFSVKTCSLIKLGSLSYNSYSIFAACLKKNSFLYRKLEEKRWFWFLKRKNSFFLRVSCYVISDLPYFVTHLTFGKCVRTARLKNLHIKSIKNAYTTAIFPWYCATFSVWMVHQRSAVCGKYWARWMMAKRLKRR